MNFKLKHFTSIWNRENLNNLNNLVDFVQNFVESKGEALFDAETFATWLSENKIEIKEAVATQSSLPTDPNTFEIRAVTDENAVYIYTGSKWVKYTDFNFSQVSELQKNYENVLNTMSSNYTELNKKISDFYNSDENVKVVEVISNSNGEAIRYSDGIQICFHDLDGEPIETTTGQMYRSNGLSWSFPASFIEQPFFVNVNPASFARWGTVGTPFNASEVKVYQISPSKSSNIYKSKVTAIGRWK